MGRTFYKVGVALAAAAALLATAACGAGGGSVSKGGGTKVAGGTAVWANFGGGPSYIFPMYGAAQFTQTNISYLQQLMYRPLYWFGNGGGPSIDYSLSLADPPKFSNGNKTVTITLKSYKWSDGTPVTARDVQFWENLLVANKTSFGAYTPGDYPDNIKSFTVVNSHTFRLGLTKAYDTNWFLYNELSQITPMPQHLWDRTSATGKVGNADETTAGAKQVYAFLDGQAKKLSAYASDPLWKVVDGPWKMTAYEPSSGNVTFVPNKLYSGPVKPALAKFEEKNFTTTDAEFNSMLAGSGPDVGYISNVELKSQPALDRQGYGQDKAYSFGISYRSLNFNNPTVGPLFKQTYIRQVMQLLTDQVGIVKAYYDGQGYSTCGPVPTKPKNSFADSYTSSCPFSYNPARAKSMLAAHGWKVVPGGVDTCQKAGTGTGDCGAGIAAGTPLKFTLTYDTGGIAYPKQIAQQKSDAAKAGLDYVLDGQPPNTVASEIVPCKATQSSCKWQMGDGAWIFAPDFYPTGESLFQTGAGYNTGSYSDPTADRLIQATTLPGDSQKTLDAYQDYLAKQMPVIWQPNTNTIFEVKSDLSGVTPFNVYGSLLPEEWYFTK